MRKKLSILTTEHIKICGWKTKLEVTKMQFLLVFCCSTPYSWATPIYTMHYTLAADVCEIMLVVVYCPSVNWFPVDSECLYFGRTATTWPLARSRCISIGLRLVQPQRRDDDATFISALRHFMIRIGNQIFLRLKTFLFTKSFLP